MKEREKTVATGLVVLMLILWIGFLFHRSPRFAGSPWGGILGVTGAMLMLVPLAYLVVKRIKWLKKAITNYVPMRTLLAWHIYAGIIGPILVLLHSGHKFESLLGIALTAMTIIAVISGFVGRYMMSQFSQGIREKKAMLTELQAAYQRASVELAQQPAQAKTIRSLSGFLVRPIASFLLTEDADGKTALGPRTVIQISESIADVEYAIKTHETFKQWFNKWLKLHIVISFILYILLALHVWTAIYFGLRWFDTQPQDIPLQRALAASPLPALPVPPTSTIVASAPNEKASSEATEEFSRYFGDFFTRHWRAPVTIHGVQTIVFDYTALAAETKQNDSDYSKALGALTRVEPTTFEGDDQEKAFWINLYNFGAMKLAAENYPVDSITSPKVSEAGDPWGKKMIQLGDAAYSLSQIEKEILVPKFGDPRIVFAVSCAAVSCPDRPQYIFAPKTLNTQLDDLIAAFLTNPKKGMRLDRENKVLTLSWIFKADKHLFGEDGDIIDFVARYVPDETARWLKENRTALRLEFFEHDWTLNDIAQAEGQASPPSENPAPESTPGRGLYPQSKAVIPANAGNQ